MFSALASLSGSHYAAKQQAECAAQFEHLPEQVKRKMRETREVFTSQPAHERRIVVESKPDDCGYIKMAVAFALGAWLF